jgi:hypothetical protein
MADGELFIAHSASAEICCFIALGWPLPTRVLDTMVEAARLWNGKMASQLGDKESVLEPSLLKALAYFGIPCRGTGEKDAAIDLVLRGGPYTEIDNTLAYCMDDAEDAARLAAALTCSRSCRSSSTPLITTSTSGSCFLPLVSPILCGAGKLYGGGGASQL